MKVPFLFKLNSPEKKRIYKAAKKHFVPQFIDTGKKSFIR